MTGSVQPFPPFGGAAFVSIPEAAAYLGLSPRSIRYLVTDHKLKKVYPQPRAARVTAESLTAYREAIEQGQPPRLWDQPGNPHTAAPQPAPAGQKGGLLAGLARWGLGSG